MEVRELVVQASCIWKEFQGSTSQIPDQVS